MKFLPPGGSVPPVSNCQMDAFEANHVLGQHFNAIDFFPPNTTSG